MNYKQKLLKEELEKFNFLFEYDFYTPEQITEEEPEEDMESTEEPVDDLEGGEAPEGGEDIEMDSEIDSEEPIEDPIEDTDEVPELPEEDEVEVDITDLIQNAEEGKQKMMDLDNKISQTHKLLQNIENGFTKIDRITNRLDSIEGEIEKRNPTPKEKLEMMSLKSYPYNLKLSDYWDNKEGNYDAMDANFDKETEEYILTQKDIDDDYSDVGIAKTF